MDDDVTTPAHLEEDNGPKSKGRFPNFLAGILILADPSHWKRVVGYSYYKMSKQKVKISRINNEHAAKLQTRFGYW